MLSGYVVYFQPRLEFRMSIIWESRISIQALLHDIARYRRLTFIYDLIITGAEKLTVVSPGGRWEDETGGCWVGKDGRQGRLERTGRCTIRVRGCLGIKPRRYFTKLNLWYVPVTLGLQEKNDCVTKFCFHGFVWKSKVVALHEEVTKITTNNF